MFIQALVAGAVAGLASSPHCAAMCGPLCAASCGAHAGGLRATGVRALRYQLGRMLSYAFVGSLAGQLGALIRGSLLVVVSPWLLSLGVAIALLLLAARMWRGPADVRVQLRVPRRARATLQGGPDADDAPARRGPFARLLPLLPREPAAVGVLSVLLPCGALAAGVLLAAATGDRLAGALLMLGFSLASGAGVLGGGAVLARLAAVRNRRAGRALAVSFALGALLLGARPLLQSHLSEGAVAWPASGHAMDDADTAAAPSAAAPSCH